MIFIELCCGLQSSNIRGKENSKGKFKGTLIRVEDFTLKQFLLLGITKPCTQLHPDSSTSTQLHPRPTSSLQHPQQYLNQNIARNWVIFPNLGQKIKSSQFFLKIDASSMSRILIPDPDLDFWNFYPKIHCCPFSLKIATRSMSRMLIPNPDLHFWNFTPKSIFGQIWAQKFKVVSFVWKLVHVVFQGCWLQIQT